MGNSNLQRYLDLNREDIDPEIFGAALAVKHINIVVANGGSEIGQSGWD
jgi:hypothetical protein